jgi:trans-aconitate 2-methyltransferase
MVSRWGARWQGRLLLVVSRLYTATSRHLGTVHELGHKGDVPRRSSRGACDLTWDPERYLSFGDQRTRPALDLLARVPLADAAHIADLGCGPGNSTALLAERWPEAEIIGVDSSPVMLAQARASSVRATSLEADIAGWTADRPLDLIYSNAALHWLGDHALLLLRLMGQLSAGGVLAVQMPRNFAAPSHTLLRETAASGPWADRLAGSLDRHPVATPEWYYDLLAPIAEGLDIWATEYLHVLEGDDPVLNWTRGTALRPIMQALDADQAAAFEAAYAARLHGAYPRRADGRTLFPFRRLFMVTQRS